MQRFPSQQPLLHSVNASFHTEKTAGDNGEKASPTKSVEASTFHLDAYAGAAAARDNAAAVVGSQSELAGQRPSRQVLGAC
jgi:hypothetical protein